MTPTDPRAPRRVPFALLAFAVAATLTACAGGPPPAPEVPQYTIEQFLDTTAMFGSSFSPDGEELLVSSDRTGVFNAWAVPVDGGEPRQLTDSAEDAVMVAGWFPDDERFLYTSDSGGDELSHLFLHGLDGEVTDLTPGDGFKVLFLGWADDRSSFYIGTTERDQRFFDVFELPVETLEPELAYQDETGLLFADASPDGRRLAFAKTLGDRDSDVYLYDRDDGTLENLTEHQGRVQNQPVEFTPDGKGLYVLTDADHEFMHLVRYDLESGERSAVLRPEWDVLYAYVSETGRYLVAAINADARTEVQLLDAETLEALPLPALPDADITSVSLSRDDSRLAFYASSSRRPSDLYVLDLPDGEPRRLTDNRNPAVDPDNLVDAEVVRFASFDGLEIPGLVYRPIQASPDHPVPGLVWVHGGPGGQSRVGYSPLVQYLVNHGYAVYAINNRGSSGYGKTFNGLDNQRHGEDDLGDCVASKAMLADTGWVDPERIGIIGGSYGGYMVLAALAFEPEEFAVGVDIFGVSNWLRTLESIPPWWESFRIALYEEMGDPASDRERLERISPLFHAESIRRPLLVLQGANDPRVLKVESDEIVEAVRANDVPVEYVVFDDEGHGFLKRENREQGYRTILEFLDRHLAADGAAEEGDGGGGEAAAGA